MNQLMGIAKSGMHAFQNSMDAIANDIANVNTTSYKAKHVQFQELMANTQNANNKLLLGDNVDSVSLAGGVRSSADELLLQQGSLSSSPGGVQLAITGEGFFKVTNTAGQEFLTRDGNFHVNPDRSITNAQGDVLEIQSAGLPQNQWPQGVILIQENGAVSIQSENGNVRVGQISLYRPVSENGLVPAGGNTYTFPGENQTENSLENPAAFGQIAQQNLENSNVDLASKMSEMIVTQRAYALNVKAAQSTDEMMGMINNFKQ